MTGEAGFRLDGLTALVTGASGGLGLHFAQVLHAAGARVALTARRAERLEAAAGRLGAGAVAVPLDVTDTGAIAGAFDAAEAALGPVAVLVNNAGIGVAEPADAIGPESWDATFAVDLRGAFFVAQEAARRMRATGGGAIVNIASIAGLRAVPRLAAYAAAKAGLDHLTRALALEWARDNIRVNALAPGYVETDMNRDFFASPAGAKMIERMPLRRLGRPEDLTGPLLLLASPAGANMTGATLVVDGGHSLAGL